MNEKYDVVETANQAGTFRVFLQALEAAGLKEILKDTGPYTILAPVDDAFVKMPQTKLHDLFKPDNRKVLQSMLRNHIIVGNLMSSALKRRLVSSAAPKPANMRIVQSRERYPEGWMPRVNGASPGSPIRASSTGSHGP